MYFHHQELTALFDRTTLERGRSYHAGGRVLGVDTQSDGGRIVGRVLGSGRRPYQVLVRLRRDARGTLQVSGQCTCPVHWNCKHVVAVLLEAADRRPRHVAQTLPSGNLSPGLGVWLAGLRDVLARQEREQEPQSLLYVLALSVLASGRHLEVTTYTARRLKEGGFGKPTRFTAGAGSTARFLRVEDSRLLALLHAAQHGTSGSYVLVGPSCGALLEALVTTGRCYWQDTDAPPLQRGEPLRTILEWQLSDQGEQAITAALPSPQAILLPVAPPWYLDPDCRVCGPLVTELPDDVAAALAAAPPVPIDQADTLGRMLRDAAPRVALPQPQQPRVKERRNIKPVPCLRLYSEPIGSLRGFLSGIADVESWLDNAVLHFEYDGVVVQPMAAGQEVLRREGDVLQRMARWPALEEQALDQLASLGLYPVEEEGEKEGLVLEPRTGESGWIDLMLEGLPELRRSGWQVTVEPSFRYQMAEPDGWYVRLQEGVAEDWFGIELGVEVDGQRVNLLPVLVDYLRQLRGVHGASELRSLPDDFPMVCRMHDGRILSLPAGRARQIIDTFAELYDPQSLDRSGRLTLSRHQSSQLAWLEDSAADLHWEGGEGLREHGRRLREFKGVQEVPPPAGLRTELRHYQKDGLSWLQFLRDFRLGGVLADDMGLGKTVQTLAHLLVEKEAGRADLPSLVVAPTSLMVNWRREAERFAPELRVLTLHGPERKASFDLIPEHDLVLTTYPLLPRDADEVLGHRYHVVVLDEAQHIKNPRAKVSQLVQQVNARHRLCLTGTPMENHLGELWSLFNFLMPGMLGDERRFSRLFRTPIEKQGDQPRREQLRRRVAPFMLRRNKADVVRELPPKTEMQRAVELSGPQRDLYETIRVSMLEKVQREIERKGMDRSRIVILDALLKLRQVCCDPRLLPLAAAKRVRGSAKLELLTDMLPELVEEGRRVLLFSQFTTMLGLIELELGRLKLDYVKLTGQTRDRATPIDRFQNGEVPLFLISLKAGGSGLNLTAADAVIHYDPWWNPAVERQATDRAHRIGQDKPVFVYKLLTVGTVEEKISAMQARKQELADALFAEQAGSGVSLTAEDLQGLFEPLG